MIKSYQPNVETEILETICTDKESYLHKLMKQTQEIIKVQEKMVVQKIKNYDLKIDMLSLMAPKIKLEQIKTTYELILNPNIDLDRIYYYPTDDQIT